MKYFTLWVALLSMRHLSSIIQQHRTDHYFTLKKYSVVQSKNPKVKLQKPSHQQSFLATHVKMSVLQFMFVVVLGCRYIFWM